MQVLFIYLPTPTCGPRGEVDLSWMCQKTITSSVYENSLHFKFMPLSYLPCYLPPSVHTLSLTGDWHLRCTFFFFLQARSHMYVYDVLVNLTLKINHLKEWKCRSWQVDRHDREAISFFMALFNCHLRECSSVLSDYIPGHHICVSTILIQSITISHLECNTGPNGPLSCNCPHKIHTHTHTNTYIISCSKL